MRRRRCPGSFWIYLALLDEEFAGLPIEVLLAAFRRWRRSFLLCRESYASAMAVAAPETECCDWRTFPGHRERCPCRLFNGEHRRPECQTLRDDLRIGGFVALPLALGSHAAHGLARGVDANLATVEHLDAAMSKVWAGPAPTTSTKLETPMPISSPFLRFSCCSFSGHRSQSYRVPLHCGIVVSAVVGPAERRRIGKLLRRNKILPAQLDRIDL